MLTTQRLRKRRGLFPRERNAYRDDGVIVLRRLFHPAEMACLAAEADSLLERCDLIDKQNLRCRFQPQCDGDSCLFDTFDPVIDVAPACKCITEEPRILDLLADIYGEEARLFKDKLIFKPPGSAGCPLHQDYISWPGFPRSFVTVLVPIDAADSHNGCVEIFPGCQHAGYLSPEDGEFHELSIERLAPSRSMQLVLEPGDVAIFSGFAPHCSGPNRSKGWRRQLYLSYNAASDGGDRRDGHYEEFHRFLRRKYGEYGIVDTYFR